MATITVPEPLVHEIDELRSEGLIASAEEFAEQAIREKLSVARRDRLTNQTRVLHQGKAEMSQVQYCSTRDLRRHNIRVLYCAIATPYTSFRHGTEEVGQYEAGDPGQGYHRAEVFREAIVRHASSYVMDSGGS
ncbi:MAG: ribbon-helix-helix domain-containing protein [Planctomycetaceae bacterium]